jgi:hypothetical protein
VSLFSNSGGEDCEAMGPALVVSDRSSEQFAIAIRLTQAYLERLDALD